jgi:hypothetical protein
MYYLLGLTTVQQIGGGLVLSHCSFLVTCEAEHFIGARPVVPVRTRREVSLCQHLRIR